MTYIKCCRSVADKFKDSYLPRVKQNIAYIVCSVLFNDSNEILMVQEAKQSIRGKWYLPAGRMERNETIEVCPVCVHFVYGHSIK